MAPEPLAPLAKPSLEMMVFQVKLSNPLSSFSSMSFPLREFFSGIFAEI
jgi:hypothetical protein